MHDMDARLLQTFHTVYEQGSMTAAARLMELTQPAVSAQISRLEEDIGFSLFQRFGNRLRPTPEGEAFYREVELSLRTLTGLSRTAEKIRDGAFGTLVIATHPSAGISLLPPVLAKFARARPDARLQLFTRNSDMVRALFPSRNYDIGVVETPLDPAGLVVARYQMECVAILPPGHPLCKHKKLTPALMAGQPFVAISRERTTHHRVRSMFAAHGFDFPVVAETEFFASLCGLVAHGLGVSIVDPATAEEFAPLGLAVRRFTPAIAYEIAVFHAADRPPSALARDFLAALETRILALPHSMKV